MIPGSACVEIGLGVNPAKVNSRTEASLPGRMSARIVTGPIGLVGRRDAGLEQRASQAAAARARSDRDADLDRLGAASLEAHDADRFAVGLADPDAGVVRRREALLEPAVVIGGIDRLVGP